jgi:transcription elongation factor GreA-like protein
VCDLCDDDVKVALGARRGMAIRAEDLRRLASKIDAVASGRVLPHSDFASTIREDAIRAIKFLAEDWI